MYQNLAVANSSNNIRRGSLYSLSLYQVNLLLHWNYF